MYTLILVIVIQGAQLIWTIPDLTQQQCVSLAQAAEPSKSFEAPVGDVQAAAQCVKKDAQL